MQKIIYCIQLGSHSPNLKLRTEEIQQKAGWPLQRFPSLVSSEFVSCKVQWCQIENQLSPIYVVIPTFQDNLMDVESAATI